MDAWQVRAAEPDEAAPCVAVAEGLPDSFNESGIAQLRRDLGTDPAIVAVLGGEIAGFVVTRRKTPGIAEIAWLAVARRFQRRGIGTALMDAAEGDAWGAGVRLTEVNTLDANEPSAEYDAARRFYEGRGYELLETIDPFPDWEPGNPCAIYVKVLGPDGVG